MAQSKSFFGLRRGSTKTLTFSVYNGKQVTKDRVTDVKNPRSASQMKQRAVMATALRGYSALKEICDHSFEGITYGQKSMNYFVAENARMIRAAAPNVNLSLSKGNSVSNAYIISKGSIPEVALSSESYDTQKKFIHGVTETSSYTFGYLMGDMGAKVVGDMVTIVMLEDNPGGNASVYWIRLKLTEQNKSIAIVTSDQGVNILSSLVEGTDYETNIDNFSVTDFPITLMTKDGDTYLSFGRNVLVSDPIKSSLGIIISRKTDTGWLRSSSTMVNMFETYNYDEALASYQESGEKILNGGNV